jgi:hypothetical protein
MASIRMGDRNHPVSRDVLLLLQAAMVFFVWTVVIGILNGADITQFGRKAVLSHVHMGTLGWITMCVFAASLWLFGETATEREVRAAHILGLCAIVSMPLFSLSFAVTYGDGRVVFGSLALITICGYFGWLLIRMRRVELSVPHLGFLAAVATSVAGGVVGVLLAIKIARGWTVISSGAHDAHPGTMVIGFLIPVGMALAEWGLGWPALRRATKLGVLQIAFPFVGGVVLLVALLLDIAPLSMLAALIELVGVIIFVIRSLPAVRRVDWRAHSPARYGAAASVAIVLDIVFINYLAGRYQGDFNQVPSRQLLALDHIMFVGVLTNAVFGLLAGVTEHSRHWRWTGNLMFFGMNAGLACFVFSLIGDFVWVERLSTPVMGAGILLALVTYTRRLATSDASEAIPVGAVGTAPSP